MASQKIIGYDEFSDSAVEEARHKAMKVKEVFPYTFDVQTADSKYVFAVPCAEGILKMRQIVLTEASMKIFDPHIRDGIMPGIIAVLSGQSADYKVTQVEIMQNGMMKLGVCANTPLHSKPKWFLEVNLLQDDDFLLSFREILPKDLPSSYKGFCKLKTAEKELVIGDWRAGRDNRVLRAQYARNGIKKATLQVYPETVDILVDNV